MLSYYSTEKGDKASQQEKIQWKDKREREKYSAELGLN